MQLPLRAKFGLIAAQSKRRGFNAPQNEVAPSANASQIIGTDPGYVAGTWSSGTPTFTRWEKSATGVGSWSTAAATMPNANSAPTDTEFGLYLRPVETNDGVEAAGAAVGPVDAANYAQRLRLGYSASEVWSLVRDTSGTTAVAEVDTARNGTYTNVTLQSIDGPIPAEGDAPSFNGTTSRLNLNSASLISLFNASQGSILLWVKVSGAGIWTNGANGYFITLAADVNNWIYIRKDNANNQIQFSYKAGSTLEAVNLTPVSPTDWFSVGVSWNKPAEEFKAYYNGLQTGATQASLGTWAGSLAATQQVLGAFNTTPSNPFSGYLAYAAVKFGAVWSAADFLAMHSDF
jgi:hypothetical protein